MSGTLSTRLVVINENSGFLNQLTDVVITTASHDRTIKYNSTDWVESDVTLDTLADMNLNSVVHNDVLIWNSTLDQWENGKLSSLLSTLEAVVSGITAIRLSVYIGSELGDSARSLSVAFTDQTENGQSLTLASCGDNNSIYKKDPDEINFTFLTTLNLGEVYTNNLPAGTVFSSDHGIAGASDPFPMPFGVSVLSDTYFRFFAFRLNVVVYATSAGRDSSVTLLSGDETTVIDGPKFIPAYGSTTLECNANTEFVIVSTTGIFCGTGTYNTNAANPNIDVRLIPPLRTELITHNRNNRVTAQFADTEVTWYRQNMDQDSVTVQGGTPFQIGTGARAGTDPNFDPQGWIILRSNKPISSFTGADRIGSNATPAWPIEFLAQLFPIFSTVDGTSADFARSGINIASPYEGTARIYDESRNLVHSFDYVRGTSPPVTLDDQLFPAAGQSNPSTDGYAQLEGGWIETTTPSFVVINFNNSSVFTSDNGDETTIPGTTPDRIKAVIRRDPDGFLRRRDLDATGNETWTIC